MHHPWLEALDDLDDEFDAGSLHRARGIVADGSVVDVRVTEAQDDYLAVEALAFGTAPWPYQVELVLVGAPGGHLAVSTDCTCPVGDQCKHGAALALELRDLLRTQFGSASPAAAPAIDDLLDDLAPLVPEDGSRVGLGLEVSLGPVRGAGSGRGPDERLRLRPVRPGARRGWVRSGIA